MMTSKMSIIVLFFLPILKGVGMIDGTAFTQVMDSLPLVINTWGFTDATKAAWKSLQQDGSVLDAVEDGCSTCEREQCDGTVGYGGSPDESGETTLDAMIMDGEHHRIGAVGCLRKIKEAISVARQVMEHTNHTMLVGELATQFAIDMGFKEQSLSTQHSIQMWKDWRNNNCQPNYWKNVTPNATQSCGPYRPVHLNVETERKNQAHYKSNVQRTREDTPYETLHMPDSAQGVGETTEHKPTYEFGNHDTIGLIAIDQHGRIAAGTSTNGARFKISGRVGDSPIPGAGAYVDGEVGAAVATGDGDVMMRFLPSFLVVELMRNGAPPEEAAHTAICRIRQYYPEFHGALLAASVNGRYGAACAGFGEFQYSVVNRDLQNVTVIKVPCLT